MAGQWSVLLLFLGVSLALASAEEHEAVRRLDDTTTPDSATSILLKLWDNIALQLHSPDLQWLPALIAVIFGLPLIVASVSSFNLIMIAANFLLACVLTQSEASAIFHVEATDPLALFLGVQVAVLCAFATYKGIEAARLIYAALLGVALACVAQAPLVSLGVDQLNLDPQLEDQKWYIAAYYSFFFWIALGMYMKNLHRHIFAVCGSLIGAALITSAGAWAVTFLSVQTAQTEFKTTGHTNLHPAGGDWVDFLFMLFTGSKDLGIFAPPAGSSDTLNVDLIADRTVWFLLASGGILFQFKRMKHAKGPANQGPPREVVPAKDQAVDQGPPRVVVPAKVGEGLSQKLLASELGSGAAV